MSEIVPSTLISRMPGLLATELDGETVLMHVEQGQYYGLARTANAIWELLSQPQTLGELCEQLAARYAGPRGSIDADTLRFVRQMADERLVQLT